MTKIVPHLWFDKEAKEAAAFYASVFPESRVVNVSKIYDTPSGDCDVVSFEVWGQQFMAISAGPIFKFNPAVSFIVNFDPLLFGSSESRAREKLDEVWSKLSEGGTALMPLGQYPFSERYGWVQDKFGLSWQLMLTKPEGDPRPAILPFMMFVGKNYGRAAEAIEFYRSVFRNAKEGKVVRYGAGQAPDKEGAIMFADFMIESSWFAAMESAHEHKFDFNEAVSFIVYCEDQKEIDYYWEKLSADPESEQCGWLKDKFGVSWQITPRALHKVMVTGSKEQVARVTQAFLPMKKFDLAALERAFAGK